MDFSHFSDVELVEKADKDHAAFAALIDRYETRLAAYIRRISNGSQEDVEDILQEVFLKLYRNLYAFDRQLTFSSWLYRITHNQTISHWRKKNARPEGHEIDVTVAFWQAIADDHDTMCSILQADRERDVQRVFAQMKDSYREVLVLQFVEDKSYKEIGDILQKPPGTVATLISRAKKQFRTLCQEQELLSKDL